MELKQKIQGPAERISESQLIQKCIEIAKQQGGCIFKSEEDDEWAAEAYSLYDKAHLLSIDYLRCSMGDRSLTVSFDKQRVFETKEIVNRKPAPNNPLVEIGSNNPNIWGSFEILTYNRGKWEQTINQLYSSMQQSLKSHPDSLDYALSG